MRMSWNNEFCMPMFILRNGYVEILYIIGCQIFALIKSLRFHLAEQLFVTHVNQPLMSLIFDFWQSKFLALNYCFLLCFRHEDLLAKYVVVYMIFILSHCQLPEDIVGVVTIVLNHLLFGVTESTGRSKGRVCGRISIESSCSVTEPADRGKGWCTDRISGAVAGHFIWISLRSTSLEGIMYFVWGNS